MYSNFRPIHEFMKRKEQSFNEFFVKKMSEVRIIDLKLRIGCPYIFVHQGHCEHLMIFTDLRLMNVNDNHDLEEYPVTIYDSVSF
jgi:snRNA-activating protein complex subunit 3